ncbi:hypothetical protein [Desulfitobacterium hafniense]|uniref:hypothetical protein n=1 Tax=Desulfitobacterium hafniense TaxID=49338 RepID=UPI000382ACB5|nr:hypothetical protein [Desulfitobacterium hafniense]
MTEHYIPHSTYNRKPDTIAISVEDVTTYDQYLGEAVRGLQTKQSELFEKGYT